MKEWVWVRLPKIDLFQPNQILKISKHKEAGLHFLLWNFIILFQQLQFQYSKFRKFDEDGED